MKADPLAVVFWLGREQHGMVKDTLSTLVATDDASGDVGKDQANGNVVDDGGELATFVGAEIVVFYGRNVLLRYLMLGVRPAKRMILRLAHGLLP